MEVVSPGTGTMLRLAIRRDRWLLPSCVLGFAAMGGFSAAATSDLYPEQAQRVAAAEVVNATPSLVALYGRIYDPTSLGSLSLFKLTAFGAALVALLMAVIVVRHTRAEEEVGRLELVGSGVVSRAAPLVAALVMALGTTVLLGVATAVALVLGGLPVAGSIAFGASWAAAGVVLATVAAVAAQMATSRRAAIGLCVGAVAIAYALRAVGDLPQAGPSALTWVSPIGWSQQVRPFAGDRWWVLLLPIVLSVALTTCAFILRARRDLGAGVFSDRPGPVDGRLRGGWSLAVRLNRGAFIAWALAFAAFGVVLGSLASSATGMLDSPAMQRILVQLGGEQGLVDAFIAAEIGIMGAIVAAFGIAATSHLRSEENAGHSELLLSRSLPRWRWATSHFGLAIVGVVVLMLVAGLFIGVGQTLDTGSTNNLGAVLAAALATVPAAWVLAALVLFVFGWAPRFTGVVWGLLIALVVVGEFGSFWGAPQWVVNASPFVHTPKLPVEVADLLPLALLVAISALVAGAGYAGLQRRDVSNA